MTDNDQRISDPTRIRAAAHPRRINLLDVLGDEGEATATRCAELTGTTVANCSFHLRILAKHGYIERVDASGREKPWRWRTVQRNRTSMPDCEDPASVRATQELGTVQATHETERVQEWIRRADTEDPEWVRYIRSNLGDRRATGFPVRSTLACRSLIGTRSPVVDTV